MKISETHATLRLNANAERLKRSAIGIDSVVAERIEFVPASCPDSKSPGSYLIYAYIDAGEPLCCDHCGQYQENYQKRKHVFTARDTPLHGLPCKIEFHSYYYICGNCNGYSSYKRFVIDSRRQMTKRLIDYIEDRVLARPSADLQRDTGLSQSTISNIRDELVEAIEKSWDVKTPLVLGIDDIKIAGSVRTVFVDSLNGEIIGLVGSKNKKEVQDFLETIPRFGEIQYVTMDLDNAYISAVEEKMPLSQIVYDKFHLFEIINSHMDNIRKEFEKEVTHISLTARVEKNRRSVLTKMEKRSFRSREFRPMKRYDDLIDSTMMPDIPFLKDCYLKKEELLATFDKDSYEAGLEAFEAWNSSLDKWYYDILQRYNENLYRIARSGIGAMKKRICPIDDQNNLDRYKELKRSYSGLTEKLSNARAERANYSIRKIAGYGLGYTFNILKDRIMYSSVVPSRDLLECYQCKSRFLSHKSVGGNDFYYDWNVRNPDHIVKTQFCSTECLHLLYFLYSEPMEDGLVNKPIFHSVRSNPRRARRRASA